MSRDGADNNDGVAIRSSASVYRLPAARYQKLYDSAPGLFCTLSAEGKIDSINAYGAAKLGYRPATLIGRDFLDLHAEPSRQLVRRQLSLTAATPGDTRRWEAEMIREGGSNMWVRAHGRWTRADDGTLEMLIVAEDVTDARDVQAELRRQASVDPLTGLMNRRTYGGRVQDVIERTSADHHHTLGYVDLDRFKLINDNCGHDAGDRLLQQLSELMRNKLRTRDMLARLGGDEFSFLLEHCPLEQAERIAAELLESVNSYRFQWEDDSFSIGLSIGLTSVRDDSSDAAHVLARADAACRNAKASGRNCVRVYAPGNSSDLAADTRWAARLHEALDTDGFTLHLQPIFAAPTTPEHSPGDEEVIAHEALVRLRATGEALVLPGAFLTAAARFELAPAIDIWVLQTLTSHIHETGASKPIHLNVSATTLQSEEYLTTLKRLVIDHPEMVPMLALEVAETDALDNPQAAALFCSGVRALGIDIILDRFGTGIASFKQLRTLAPSIVKLDADLIAALDLDNEHEPIVRAVCEVCHALEIKTVATGIERSETLAAVMRLPFDAVQGLMLAAPAPLNGDVEASTDQTD